MDIIHGLWIDRRDERAFSEQGPIKLGRNAFHLLLALVDAEGRLVTKDELFESIWSNVVVSDAALTSTVHELRANLRKADKHDLIETVYGRGYRLRISRPALPERRHDDRTLFDAARMKTLESRHTQQSICQPTPAACGAGW